jgi:hypothetical protein
MGMLEAAQNGQRPKSGHSKFWVLSQDARNTFFLKSITFLQIVRV